jgi:two-component system, OmpR family, response regulator CpxR
MDAGHGGDVSEQGVRAMGRPRKTILLVDADERHAGELRYVLEVAAHFRVLVARDAAAALALHALGVDLVLGWLFVPGMGAGELAARLKAQHEEVPILWMGTQRMCEFPSPAVTQALPLATTSTVTLLDRVRTLIARRRGPRRVRVMAPVPAMAAGD